MKGCYRTFKLIVLVALLLLSVSAYAQLSQNVKFMVFSDPHIYDEALGTEGVAWETYLQSDRKMLAQSESILKSAVDMIIAEAPDFVIVPGDLTKDGERQCHELFASYLKQLEDAGIPAFVAPGNHDINNPHAFSFQGDSTVPLPTVTPAQFDSIYEDYGFGEAIARDLNSLSYIAEPVDGVWIFSLDCCLYTDNTEKPETGGKFSEATLSWIDAWCDSAAAQNKLPIGMMHHGLLEHYTGQKLMFSEYVIDDYLNVSARFAAHGLELVFTGHYHAQDIAVMVKDGSHTVIDVETGSLVTYPCPVRTVTIDTDLIADIQSQFVTEIDYDLGGVTFPEFAQNFLLTGLNQIVLYTLMMPVEQRGYGVPQDTAAQYAPYIANAFAAHYAGDESPTLEILGMIQTLMASEDANELLIGSMLGALWLDETPDNTNTAQINMPTSIALSSSTLRNFALYPNYPNPFNPETTIGYRIARPGRIKMTVYDLKGRQVDVLVDGWMNAGEYTQVFSEKNLASGVYFVQLQNENMNLIRKITLMK